MRSAPGPNSGHDTRRAAICCTLGTVPKGYDSHCERRLARASWFPFVAEGRAAHAPPPPPPPTRAEERASGDSPVMAGPRIFPGAPIRTSPTCVEWVAGAWSPDVVAIGKRLDALAEQARCDERALSALRQRELELSSQLAGAAEEVDRAEANAHGVLRVDPPTTTPDGPIDLAVLRARAHARAEEWAAVLGGGRISLSQPLSSAQTSTSGAGGASVCDCRREAWAVQLYAKARRVNVAAVRLSALPPDGTRSQLVDITWLDAQDSGGASAAGVHHGLPRLVAFLNAIAPPIEAYDPDATASMASRLELPPPDYVHLRSQPLLRPGGGESVQLSRTIAALGAELCAWATLGEPLPPAEGGALATLQWARTQPPAAQMRAQLTGGGAGERATRGIEARADLAVRWWSRLALYLGSAILGHAELGLRGWLATANASLRAHQVATPRTARGGGGGGGGRVGDSESRRDAPTPLALMLRIARHPLADDARRQRIAQVLEWLGAAPPPVGSMIEDARARAPSDARGTYW